MELAYKEVRVMHRSIKSVKECDQVIKQWIKERNSGMAEGEKQEGHDAMQAAAVYASKFSDILLAVVKLLGDTGSVDLKRIEDANAAKIIGHLYSMLQHTESLIRLGVNPHTLSQQFVVEARNKLFSESGRCKMDPSNSLVDQLFNDETFRDVISDQVKDHGILKDMIAVM